MTEEEAVLLCAKLRNILLNPEALDNAMRIRKDILFDNKRLQEIAEELIEGDE